MNIMRFRFLLSLFGLLMALVAILVKDTRITWFAIVVLAVALLLRFAARRAPPTDPDGA